LRGGTIIAYISGVKAKRSAMKWFYRGLVIGLSLIFTLLPNRKIHPSQAVVASMSVECLYEAWKEPSLRLLKGRELATYFEELASKRKLNGTVLVAERGTILHQGAYGYADLREKEPMKLESAFQLASVSKVFTATAVLLLVQEGKLGLDDLLSDHLKGWPYEDMTVRNLLNHRSGMGRYMAVASWYWKDWRRPMSNADVLSQYVRKKPPIYFWPDRNFNYCNTNYVILASLVEEISGQSFADFMQERVFDPLKMKQAMIYSRVEDPLIPEEAIGYKAGRRGFYRAPNDYIDGVVGDKGMYASVMDLYKFDQALYEGEFLRRDLVESMGEYGGKRRRSAYGMGWRIKKRDGRKILYHFGWWRGFRTCFIRDLEKEQTIIVLTNKDQPGLNLKYWDIFDELQTLDVEW
jgi:CubicO group peptidase (beta-lactamase class C family)